MQIKSSADEDTGNFLLQTALSVARMLRNIETSITNGLEWITANLYVRYGGCMYDVLL
jgi:hypothetical protein